MRTPGEVTTALAEAGFLPVVTIHRPDDAVPLGEAFLRAGVTLIEVTFRTDAAHRAIVRLRGHLPELLVAAGTVTDSTIVERAIDAGAAFAVSPGLNPDVVDYCVERRIPIVPGVNDASAIEIGRAHGISTFNFFPAEASGGTAMLRALSRPFGGVRFLCSGGMTLESLPRYLEVPEVVACAGSWVASPESIAAGAFERIESDARATVDLVRAHRQASVEIQTREGVPS